MVGQCFYKVNDALIPEADKVIKKIYDEAETTFNEEEPESQRADCRLWGVIYISIGNDTAITVQLKHLANDLPIVGAGVKLVEAAGKIILTNAQGIALFNTKVVGDATLAIYLDPNSPEPDLLRDIKVKEEIPLTVTIEI